MTTTDTAPVERDRAVAVSEATPDPRMRPVAEFVEVVKDYPTNWLRWGMLRAVDHVSLTIAPGEVFGLLGPNRAGKTTLVKILLSLTQPTSGTVKRFDQPTTNRETLKRIGYVHENQAFPRYLTATELLRYYGALSQLSTAKIEVIVPILLEKVGLADRAREPISRFSKGMVQRLGLAQALLNDPDLLVLDEPAEGLDLDGRRMVADLIAQRREAGKTVLLVTHLLAEAERVCDRVAVILGGKIVRQGTVAELTNQGTTSLEETLSPIYAAGRTAVSAAAFNG
ncbi:ABC transporter related protein [Isosphaera pallida ATCC 43644]|uniref:ABC transporter related protein n=2 Tax=Isosphaera pallida TaxID=128 RepID=E8R5H5_ISOPI|nr:ABC transporter related protein [Isosphaera pallida ATCC 43644]